MIEKHKVFNNIKIKSYQDISNNGMQSHNSNVGKLVRILGREGYSPIITEMRVPGTGEVVDLWAMNKTISIMYDWKNSLSDAIAHMKKPHVTRPDLGVGQFRCIVCSPHVIEPEDINDSWWPTWLGLSWLSGESWSTIKPARIMGESGYNLKAERLMLAKALSKANWQQHGAVKRATVIDEAHSMIKEQGPLHSRELKKLTGYEKPASRLADMLDADPRFNRDGAGGAFDVT